MTTKRPPTPTYINVLETDWPPELAKALHASLARLGSGATRYLTFGTGALNRTETQLSPDVMMLARAEAERTGIRKIYVPKRLTPAPAVLFDTLAASWMKREGFSLRTISDLFGVAHSTAFNLLADVEAGPPVVRAKGEIKSREFAHGMAWLRELKRLPDTPSGRKQVLATYGAQRIIRVGALLMAYRAAHGRKLGAAA